MQMQRARPLFVPTSARSVRTVLTRLKPFAQIALASLFADQPELPKRRSLRSPRYALNYSYALHP